MVTNRWGWIVVVVALAWLGNARAQEIAGAIRGVVYDVDAVAPLANCRVTVIEATLSALTSEDGQFLFQNVPAGNYTLAFTKDGYERQVVPNVVVNAAAITEVRGELQGEVTEMEEFVVRSFDLLGNTEAGLLEVRQDTAAAVDAISADFIKKAGASTAAAALKLVVGTTVQEGKYVVVRGLSDRYTTTLLNGIRLPTADAEKRAVQLDQFPGSFIESIAVSKTFTPDQQGDSTGGSVDIKTRAMPDKVFLSVSGAVEYNPQVTGNSRYLTYRGGGVEPFAMDDGGRARPFPASRLPELPPINSPQNLNKAQLIDAMTRSFAPVMGVSRETAGPNYSWSVAAGDSREVFGSAKLGMLGGFSYRQKYGFHDDGQRNVVIGSTAGTPLVTTAGLNEERGTDEVLWGAMGGLGLELSEDHELRFTLSYSQTATDEARLLSGGFATNLEQINQTLRYQERSTSSLQLHGNHKLPNLADTTVDWTAAYNSSTQSEPDFRSFREVVDTQSGIHSITGQGFDFPRRVFREISEGGPQVLANITTPFTQWRDVEGKVKVGVFMDQANRDFTLDTFFYDFRDPTVNQYQGEGTFADVFLQRDRVGLGPGNVMRWFVIHPSQIDVDYTAEQLIRAGYGMIELPITSRLKLIGGARLEATTLTIDIQEDEVVVPRISESGDTFFEIVSGEQASTELDEVDILPAAGLNWEAVENLFFRLAWSRTIARPTFRELAPARSFDFIGGEVFIGNSQLTMSHIDNYDLRVEWFRRPGEVIAGSIFYKTIEDPIEQIAFDVSGGDRFTQRVNYPEGRLYGIEGEYRQRLDIVHYTLKDFTFGVNASYIVSEVTLPDDEQARLEAIGVTTKDRPLLGQPEYIFNVNLVYDNPRSGTSAAIFYTLTGEVLVSGESRTSTYVPNVYESPIDSLDFSLEQKVGPNWRVTFRAKNLTDPVVERVYRASWNTPDVVQSSYKRGQEFSLGATYAW